MKSTEIIKSKEYKNASEKIVSWRKKLEKANKKDTKKIRDAKTKFFTDMRESNAELYWAFRIDDKILSELIHQRLTGQEITID